MYKEKDVDIIAVICVCFHSSRLSSSYFNSKNLNVLF